MPAIDELFFEMAIGKASAELESAVRTRVDFFRKTHGWMFALIAPFHPEFTGWLDAPG
ncbi:hypothetical protein D3C83_285950 [compost metagenome]